MKININSIMKIVNDCKNYQIQLNENCLKFIDFIYTNFNFLIRLLDKIIQIKY